MMKNDHLTQVREALRADEGKLRHVANKCGLSYDTILRIKNEEGDPGYSKVNVLVAYYRIGKKRKSV